MMGVGQGMVHQGSQVLWVSDWLDIGGWAKVQQASQDSGGQYVGSKAYFLLFNNLIHYMVALELEGRFHCISWIFIITL